MRLTNFVSKRFKVISLFVLMLSLTACPDKSDPVLSKAKLSVTPTELNFGSDKTSLTFNIKNDGQQNMTWQISKSVDWISDFKTTSEELEGGNQSQITVAINRAELNKGDNQSNIQVTAKGTDNGQLEGSGKDVIVKAFKPSPPEVTMAGNSVTQKSSTSARVEGRIEDIGTSKIKDHGFVWSKQSNPTIEDGSARKSLGERSVIGAFQTNVTGLDAKTTYHVRAYAANEQGTSYSSVDITFETLQAGANNPPTDILLSKTSITENNSVNAVVGVLSTTDADAGDTHTYTLVTGSSDFKINRDTLQSAKIFDYDAKSTYPIRIKTSDGKGGTFEKAFTITITKVGSGGGSNKAPSVPSLTSPADGATNIALNTKLIWQASTDADGDALTYDVYLGKSSSPTTKVSNGQSSLSYTPTGQANSTKYYWKIVAKDGKIEVASAVRNYTTTAAGSGGGNNKAPSVPSLTSPADGATNIALNTKLIWQASTDADGDPITYDVFLGTNNPPTTKVSNGQSSLSYTPTGQANSTKYYWKIVAKDGKTEVASAVRNYTTTAAGSGGGNNKAPSVPSLTSPADGATNIALNTKLIWQASTDADGDPITYDVFLGTNNPPTTKVSNGQSSLSYTPTGQANSTKYYWKIVAKDGKTEVASAVRNYTTTASSAISHPNDGSKGTITYNGKTYKTVKIGTQWWLAQNLNDDSHNNGNSYCYQDNTSNCITYGRLYDWYAAVDIANKIPGWHLPTDDEWKTLEIALGMSKSEADDTGWRGSDEGTQLKQGGSSGFNVIFAGYRATSGFFYNLGAGGFFWSASPSGSSTAWYRHVDSGAAKVDRDSYYRSGDLAVRLVKD